MTSRWLVARVRWRWRVDLATPRTARSDRGASLGEGPTNVRIS
eukprot:COSAG02_NODE_55757_length_288_cov_6.867725_1_plen_42_part_01